MRKSIPAKIRVGVMAEDPYDTSAIANLLGQRYSDQVHFFPLVRKRTGSKLDNNRTADLLRAAVLTEEPRIVLFVRDLDGVRTEKPKVTDRQQWYKRLTAHTGKRPTCFLLNTYELEALILADLEVFNREYGASIRPVGDVAMKPDPKGHLHRLTARPKARKQYEESHVGPLFALLRIQTISDNCAYFKQFLNDFDALIKPKKPPTTTTE